MPRYKLTIAYDGTEFCGWQKQEPYVSDAYRVPIPAIGEANPDAYAMVQGLVQREGEQEQRVQLRTVQHVVERAVREIVREPAIVMGASRTDAGVHARGQVAAFTCEPRIPKDGTGEPQDGRDATPRSDEATSDESALGGQGEHEGEHFPQPLPTGKGSDRGIGWPVERGVNRLRRAINGRLPDDVTVVSVEVAGTEFDPIRDCVSKGYSYTLHLSPPPPRGAGLKPLWDRKFVHHQWDDLDVGLMREGAKRIVGEHDFAAFATSGHGRENTVRTVHDLEITELEPFRLGAHEARRVRIDVSGNGFLYNMVRIIAGTLVEVGKGKMSAEDVARAILSKDRRNAGPTLPPEGLCLEWVRY